MRYLGQPLIFFVNMNSYAATKIVVIPLGGDPVKMGEPIAYTCSFTLFDSESSDLCDFPVVPDGKVLVVEFVSGQITLPHGQAPYAELALSTTNSFSIKDNIYVRYQAPFSVDKSLYIINQPVKIYIDEKTTPSMRLRRYIKTGVASGNFRLNGYLVNNK